MAIGLEDLVESNFGAVVVGWVAGVPSAACDNADADSSAFNPVRSVHEIADGAAALREGGHRYFIAAGLGVCTPPDVSFAEPVPIHVDAGS